MRKLFIVLFAVVCSITSAAAEVSVSIGINFPVYPQLVLVPGYPVYYAPQVNANYFFYDGMYWVYQGDNWYVSTWYNGPWSLCAPEAVPLFVLRVPVRYYRRPPVYFHGWASNAPPRWGDHWGNAWVQSHQGWDNWDRSSVPAAAPLPTYQRQYSGNRYPRAEQQQLVIQSRNYRYQPRDAFVQQQYQARVQSAPAAAPNVTQGVSRERAQQQQQRQAASEQKVQQQQQRQAASEQKAQQQQQRQAASEQKAQQEQQRRAASQQRAQQQQQQRQAASEQRAQQEQQRRAASEQKAQQQQQRQAASQQRAQQQQQQRQAASEQRAQQEQQRQAAPQPRAQQQPQVMAQHEQKAPKRATEKGEQQRGEQAK